MKAQKIRSPIIHQCTSYCTAFPDKHLVENRRKHTSGSDFPALRLYIFTLFGSDTNMITRVLTFKTSFLTSKTHMPNMTQHPTDKHVYYTLENESLKARAIWGTDPQLARFKNPTVTPRWLHVCDGEWLFQKCQTNLEAEGGSENKFLTVLDIGENQADLITCFRWKRCVYSNKSNCYHLCYHVARRVFGSWYCLHSTSACMRILLYAHLCMRSSTIVCAFSVFYTFCTLCTARVWLWRCDV
jgi:hypothetical protein